MESVDARPGRDQGGTWAEAALLAAPTPMGVVDATGRVLLANGALGAAFGRDPSRLRGCRFDALLEPGSVSAWADALAVLRGAAVSAEPPATLALTGLRGGRSFPVELSLTPLRGALAVVVLRDVTRERDARQLEAEDRRRSDALSQRLDALLTFAPAFIIAVSRDGKIEFINRTLPQYTREATIGTSWLQYFDPSQHAWLSQLLEEVYRTGLTKSYELSTPGADGTPVWFESRIAPMRVDGEVVRAVLVSQDVTDRKRAQAEVLAGRPMALLGTLASGIAHEINTPVQFVGDNIHFLREASTDLFTLFEKLQALRLAAANGAPIGEIAASAARAEEEADLAYLRVNMPAAFESCSNGLSRVSTIVRSLKEFAHPSEAAMAPADLNRAIQSSVAIAINEYKYVADLELDLGEIPPVTCRLDEIAQAILNVLVNAAHAIEGVVAGTDRKGVIAIRTRRDGDSVVIAIKDTGPGIAESIQARVFDPFFTTKDVGKGTGQGLAIARTAVNEHHGGQLTFETTAGEGTTFFLRLPIEPSRPSSVSEGPRGSAP